MNLILIIFVILNTMFQCLILCNNYNIIPNCIILIINIIMIIIIVDYYNYVDTDEIMMI